MILTDREIISALRSQQLFIEPPPGEDAYSSTTVDLTLLNQFTTWKSTPGLKERVRSPAWA